jgi:hypothetical protein
MAFDRGSGDVGTGAASVLPITGGGTGADTALEAFSNLTEGKVVVDSAGNVGIGTSSPSSLGKFVVVSAGASATIVANGGGTGDPEFRLSGASGGVTRNYAMGTDSQQRLYWYDYTASAYRMVIDSSGNVGIGVNSPTVKLDIAGPINTSPGISVNTSSNNSADMGAFVYLGNDHATSGTNYIFLDTDNSGGPGAATVPYIALRHGAGTGISGLLVGSSSGGDSIFSFVAGGGFLSSLQGTSTIYPAHFCRAWVNFNGTGTVSIRASGNVSSITDNGVGSYRVNLTSAMPDTNYSVVSNNSSTTNSFFSVNTSYTVSSSAFDIFVVELDGYSGGDCSEVYSAVFR